MKLMEVNYEELSPMMKQYYDIKKNYQGILLFYRLGDFYELFFEDAEIASRELNLTLTGKSAGLKERVPMCGVPHHSVQYYLQTAISKGYKLAICEQMEDPKQTKGMVKREVTEVISQGTITDLDFLDNKDFNYLGSIIEYPSSYVITYADISTGELNSTSIEKNKNKLFNIVLNNGFKEVIVTNDFEVEIINKLKNIYNVQVSISDNLLEEYNHIFDDLADLKVIKGVKHILYYLKIVELKDITIFNKINLVSNSDSLYMDTHTIRNLELFETLRTKERQNSLISLLDKCKTAMGSRKLKSWMLKPLINKEKIENRYDKIEILKQKFMSRSALGEYLYEIYDIERLCGKALTLNITARDLLQLYKSIRVLPQIKDIVNEINLGYEIETFDELSNLIESSISEDAPISVKEGGIIKNGYNSELDELRNIRSGGKKFILEIESQIKEETGINSLKIGYNKIFGYYIEVSKNNKDKISDNLGWERKQTLVNAERYTSPLLKEKENMILNAEEKIEKLEYELFLEIRDKVKENVHELSSVANIIAEIDALYSLSIVSDELGLVRPVINDEAEVNIIGGKHPVVEKVCGSNYVSNDIIMDKNVVTLLITGPNMSGKSTYMREFAIIVIMAQMGSFVPAESASIPIFDKIFTRIGASDDLVSGDSTFMVEMKEANDAIENATSKSLILFDELGRGTATYDGMSIARAILEYISENIKCKTLFSTHYHELTLLSKEYANIKNVHVSAKEEKGQIYFLHKVQDGAVDKSYGLHVASLAGLPEEIIDRAQIILKEYEGKNKEEKTEQITMSFNENNANDDVKKYIEKIDIDGLSPRDALDTLYALKEFIK